LAIFHASLFITADTNVFLHIELHFGHQTRQTYVLFSFGVKKYYLI